jgi:membrane-bound ClpP family serine protease
MGRLCFSTYVVDIKECDAPESNNTTTELSLTRNIPMTTSEASWASSIATWLTDPQA